MWMWIWFSWLVGYVLEQTHHGFFNQINSNLWWSLIRISHSSAYWSTAELQCALGLITPTWACYRDLDLSSYMSCKDRSCCTCRMCRGLFIASCVCKCLLFHTGSTNCSKNVWASSELQSTCCSACLSSTGAWEEQAPTCRTIIQMWLIYL